METHDLLAAAARKYLSNVADPRKWPGRVAQFEEEISRLRREFDAGLIRPRQVLVVGAAGYIGSVLCRELLSRGYQVTGLDALLYDNAASLAGLVDNPSFSLVQGDFCSTELLEKCLRDVTDVVLLAALVGDPICRKYADEAKRINLEGTKNLVNCLAEESVNKFVFLSTCSNYGLRSTDDYATEAADLNPQSLYAETKVRSEEYMLEQGASAGFSTTILRCATAYGASDRMRFDLTVAQFTRELTVNRELLVYDEHTWRPYCHVLDISDAIIRVLEAPREKVRCEVFNIGSTDENYTKKMIVDIISSHLTDLDITYKEGGHDPRNYRVSFDKAAQQLGHINRFTVRGWIPSLIGALQNGAFSDVSVRPDFYGNYAIKSFRGPARK